MPGSRSSKSQSNNIIHFYQAKKKMRKKKYFHCPHRNQHKNVPRTHHWIFKSQNLISTQKKEEKIKEYIFVYVNIPLCLIHMSEYINV